MEKVFQSKVVPAFRCYPVARRSWIHELVFEKVFSFFLFLQEDKASQRILVWKSHHHRAEIQLKGDGCTAWSDTWCRDCWGRAGTECLGSRKSICCFSELIKWNLVPFSQASITRWVSSHSLVQSCSTASHAQNLVCLVCVDIPAKSTACFRKTDFQNK